MNRLPTTCAGLLAAVLLAACAEPDSTPSVPDPEAVVDASEAIDAATPAEPVEQAVNDAVPDPAAVPTDNPAAVDAAAPPPPAADVFMAALAELCGKAFAGRVVEDTPPSDDDPFAGKPLVMHVRECSADEIRIPLHVGDDRSRTWVLTRTERGLRLKHDHRHQDGSPDAVTMYGGDVASSGTAQRQEFPVDEESIALFRAQGSSASVTNVWALEVHPGRMFAYELARPGRLFRIEFDLTAPVAPPPDPWGATTP